MGHGRERSIAAGLDTKGGEEREDTGDRQTDRCPSCPGTAHNARVAVPDVGHFGQVFRVGG